MYIFKVLTRTSQIMIHHKKFIGTMIVTTFMFLFAAIIYLIYSSLVSHSIISIFLKAMPVLLIIIQCTIYVKIYNFHNYVVGMIFVLIFFLGGDVFLALSDYCNNNLYFFIGIIFFLIARILLTIVFVINPYGKTNIIIYKFKKWHICCYTIILLTIPTCFVVIKLWIKQEINLKNLRLWILLFYVLFCSISCCFSFMRYGLFHESTVSIILMAIGISLITVSDTIIGINMFMHKIKYQHIIIISLYWFGCLLMMWSIIRNWKSEFHEKISGNINFNELGIFDLDN